MVYGFLSFMIFLNSKGTFSHLSLLTIQIEGISMQKAMIYAEFGIVESE